MSRSLATNTDGINFNLVEHARLRNNLTPTHQDKDAGEASIARPGRGLSEWADTSSLQPSGMAPCALRPPKQRSGRAPKERPSPLFESRT